MPVEKVYYKSTKEAVQHGDVHELQRLVRQGKKINDVDGQFKFTPLHWASHYGSLECMHWLLWHGSEVNRQTINEGWTATHISAIRGRDNCLQALLSNGADLNIQDKRGKTVGHLAASHGNTNTLHQLFRRGLNLETRDNAGWSIAQTGAFHGRLGCLQVAHKWGCDFKSLDDNGNSLAHLAAGEGHLSCLKFIISNADNMNIVNTANDEGETPRDLADQFFKEECIKYLLQIEYDVAHPEIAEDLYYPAHAAAYKGDLEYLKSLIETGSASVNERDERLSTPAHKAAGNGQVEVLKWLIENGTDLTAVNESGETARDIAIRFGQLACIKLLGGGQDTEYINEGENIIHETPFANSSDAKDRSLKKVEELQEQLEIAKMNYQQFGGVLKEDEIKIKEHQEHTKTIRSFEQKLQYEREKREKLESQLDRFRVQVHHLQRQLNDSREQLKQALELAANEKNDQKKLKKKLKKKKPSRPGIFLVRTSYDNPRPSTAVSHHTAIKPIPPARPKTATFSKRDEADDLNVSKSSLRSFSSKSSFSKEKSTSEESTDSGTDSN